METPTETEAPLDREIKAASGSGEMVVGFAIMGCLMAGGVGIWKATNMASGLDVFWCLLGAVASFGVVFYIFLGRR